MLEQSVNRCHICETELVFLEEKTVSLIRKNLKPNFRSLQPAVSFNGKAVHPICPRCDAYALGSDLEAGFKFITVHQESQTIHDPAYQHIFE